MSTKRGYARTVSLTNPILRPEGFSPEKIAAIAQEHFHVIDADHPNRLTTLDIKTEWRQLLQYHPDFSAYAQVFSREDGRAGKQNLLHLRQLPAQISRFLPPREKNAEIPRSTDGRPRRHRVRLRADRGLLLPHTVAPLLDKRVGPRRMARNRRKKYPPPGRPHGHARRDTGNTQNRLRRLQPLTSSAATSTAPRAS